MGTPRHLLFDLARWIDEEQIAYAVVGGVAVVRYGYVRETKDVDVLVASSAVERLGGRLSREGFRLVATDGANFQIYRRGRRHRIDLLMANNAFLRRVLEKRAPARLGESILYFATIEHLVGMKLRAYLEDPERRAQDREDVKGLLARSEGEDRRKILSVIGVYGLEETL